MSARIYKPNSLKAKVIRLIKSPGIDLETLAKAFHSLSSADRGRLGYVAQIIRVESL